MNVRTPFEVFKSFGFAVMVFGVTTETQPVFKPPDTLILGAGEPADLGNAARYCPSVVFGQRVAKPIADSDRLGNGFSDPGLLRPRLQKRLNEIASPPSKKKTIRNTLPKNFSHQIPDLRTVSPTNQKIYLTRI
jgi:hypothetical protein